MEDYLISQSHKPENHSNYQIGKYIFTHWEDIEENSIVLFSISEYRGNGRQEVNDFSMFRENFYSLAAGNWKLPIFDIGHILPGETLEDSYYALQTVLQMIVNRKALPIILGGSQDLMFVAYKVLQQFQMPLNYTSVDSTIPLSNQDLDDLRADNLLNHLINEPEELLFQFSNIGYQSYLSSYQIIDTLQTMSFDAIRLGEIVNDLKESEPIFRSSELISFNWNALQAIKQEEFIAPNPNGFNSREICALAKFAGLSSQLKIFGLFNYIEKNDSTLNAQLLSQCLWYLIEGKNLGIKVNKSNTNYKTYVVMHKDKEIVFVQDESINKWWIQLAEGEGVSYKILIPCTEKDYIKATENEIPDRYWKSLQKYL